MTNRFKPTVYPTYNNSNIFSKIKNKISHKFNQLIDIHWVNYRNDGINMQRMYRLDE